MERSKKRDPETFEEAWTNLNDAVKAATKPLFDWLENWLTPTRFLVVVFGTVGLFLAVGIAYGHPEVALLPIAVYFAARLLAR